MICFLWQFLSLAEGMANANRLTSAVLTNLIAKYNAYPIAKLLNKEVKNTPLAVLEALSFTDYVLCCYI